MTTADERTETADLSYRELGRRECDGLTGDQLWDRLEMAVQGMEDALGAARDAFEDVDMMMFVLRARRRSDQP